jgi:radical SAM superfamily enzyme YgiQ (UPF0313 family)
LRVLFLEIDTESTWAVASLGPAFIAAHARREGHEVSLLRVPLALPLAEVVAKVRALRPEVLGVSLTTRQWQRGRAVIRAIRAELDVPVVAGGLHPTFSAPEVLANPGFDYVCLGEGEEPMKDLLAALSQGKAVGNGAIPNIWVRGGGRPALRQPFEPLDALPFMARDMLDERWGVYHMATQRGCPFPCTYCAARMYDELYTGTGDYGRRRSHESVLREIDELRARGAVSYIIFLDDTFTIHHPWVKQFCRVYGERVRIPFSLHARVETVTPELLQLLARAGCRHVTYGIESGSLRVRREIMKRPVSNQRFIDVFRWTREVGIFATANYMLGLPGETKADIEETLAIHDQVKPDDFGYFVFYPYPGTELFRECLEKGYLPEDYLDRPADHRASILRLPDLTPEDIAHYYDRFTAIRTRDAIARQGRKLAPEQEADLAEQMQRFASTG